MRAPLAIAFLILVSAVATAACIDILQATEGLDPHYYADQARLGEIYKNAGECYSEEGNARKKIDHYKLSGDYYFNASESFVVAGDYEKKMKWYMSSGDSYLAADRGDLAKASYEKAKDFYELHSPDIDTTYYVQVQKKLHDADNPLSASHAETETRDEYSNYASIGIAAIVIVGIALIILYIGK